MARRGYLGPGIIALVALAVLALVINFAALDRPSPHRLSRSDAARLISQGLQAQQGSASRPQVTCPADEPVRAGLRFECTLHHPDGTTQAVQVTETDGHGDLRFSVVEPG